MSENEQVGIDDVQALLKLMGKSVDIGLEIAKDGINKEDLKYAPQVMKNLKEIVAFIAAKPHVAQQVKDIDLIEGYELVMSAIEIVKDVSEPGIKE